MGAKTTQFMQSIGTLTLKVEQELSKAKQFEVARKVMFNQADEIIKAMDAVTEKHMPGGSQSTEGEKAVENDPDYKKASALFDELQKRRIAMKSKEEAAVKELQKARLALATENAAFEKFVIAKKAKWLGSKDSVPAAEKCIAETKLFLTKVAQII